MRNKKFLSTLLVLIMICAAAFGMLVTDAGAERTAVAVAWDTDLATTIGSINGASFDGTQYAEITVPSGTTVSATVQNGVLFGVNTVFDSTGERLPIIIKGEDATATVSFDGVAGNVSCSNSYTFQGMNFLVADAKKPVYFFAGSGEVVLNSVVLSADGTGKNAYFYADNAAATAFSGWTKPAEGELIATSLTLKNLNYTQASTGLKTTSASDVGQIGVVGSAADFANADVTPITAAMTSAELIIEDAKLGDVLVRSNSAMNPVAEVNLTILDSAASSSSTKDDHKTQIYRLSGVGKISANESVTLPAFNYNVNIGGGYYTSVVVFQRGTNYDGNLKIDISAGYFAQDVYAAHADGYVTGTAVANLNGGIFAKTFYGPNTSRGFAPEDGDITEVSQVGNFVTIDGATIKTYQGNRVAGSIVTTMKSGSVTTYYGCYCTAGGGGQYDLVINNIEGGEIANFRGSGLSNSVESSGKKVTIVDGEETKEVDEQVPARSGYTILQLVNNFNGGTVTGVTHGAGMPKSINNVTNNFNGTVFGGNVFGVWCNMYQIHDGSYVLGATNVIGTLTNNFARAKVTDANFKGNCFFMAGDLAGDLVVDFGDFSQTYTDTLSKQPTMKQFTFYSAPAVYMKGSTVYYAGSSGDAGSGSAQVVSWQDNVIQGNYNYYANGMRATNQVELVEKVTVKGDLNINVKRGYAASHLTISLAACEGDLNINVDNLTHAPSSKYRHLVFTKTEVGGDFNVSIANVSCNVNSDLCFSGNSVANNAVCTPYHQDGNVSVIFGGGNSFKNDLAAMNLFEVGGTFTLTYRGTNTFDFGQFTNNARVGKMVNNIEGTISSNFYGTGAPVGSYTELPAAEEGGEPTLQFVPGHVENNILPGAVINGIFFGTGEDEVASVTNTMTGGKIANVAGNGAGLLSSPGCYYGNLGNVTEKVVNNIYSGSVGNNFYGSNGDLTCAVYTNIGNNLYAELNPEAEALSTPSIGRAVLAGGRYYYNETVPVDADNDGTPDVDGEGNPVTETVKVYFGDAKLGTTGPVYINVDGAKLAMTMAIFGPVVAPDSNGDAVNFTVRNATCSTHAYFNMNDNEPLNGNANIRYENFKLTASDRDYYGPANVDGNVSYVTDGFSVNGDVMLTIGDITGNASFDLKNTNFASAIGICATYGTATSYSSEYKGHSDTFMDIGGDFTMNAENVVFGADGSGFFRDVDGAGETSSIKGSIYGKYVNCTFYQESVQFSNRTAANSIQEFEGCTFGGLLAKGSTVRLAMREAAGTQLVFVHGNTVIGAEGAPAYLQASRQQNHTAYVGAKPNANYEPVSAETVLNVCEGSAFYATPGDLPEYNATVYLYDLSVVGAGLIAPVPDGDSETEGYQLPAGVSNLLVLKGNVSVGEDSPAIYINGTASEGTVSALGGNWVSGKTYITAVGDAKIEQISGRNIGTANGYACRRDNALVGASLAGNLAVSLDVNERIVLKLWLYRADVEAYLAAGMKNTVGENVFDYWASIDLTSVGEACDYYLGEGSISLADLDDLELSEDGLYFKVEIGTVSANHFGCEIEFAGSTFAVGGFSADNPLTVMSIAKAGVEDPLNIGNEKGINLFKAIYNYGASILGEEMYAMDGFVKDTALAAPEFAFGSTEDIQFTGMNLLMGDAIGIRFTGDIIDYETTVTLTVDGAPTDLFRYDVEEGTVDVYVNMEDVAREFTFVISTDGAPAVTVKASVKGFTEAVMGQDNATLAVAQLAQACADLAA